MGRGERETFLKHWPITYYFDKKWKGVFTFTIKIKRDLLFVLSGNPHLPFEIIKLNPRFKFHFFVPLLSIDWWEKPRIEWLKCNVDAAFFYWLQKDSDGGLLS
jgi:hypothetical protein